MHILDSLLALTVVYVGVQLMQHPWVLTNMPKELKTLNYHLLQSCLPAGRQTVKQIEDIVQEAVSKQPSPYGYNNEWAK